MQSDLLDLIRDVKLQLNKQIVIHILLYTGYEFNRNGKFKLRPNENTPSASVDANGNIKDFGSGWYGDIISVLKDYHGLSTLEATQYIADSVGVPYE